MASEGRHRHSANQYKNGRRDCDECKRLHTEAQARYRENRRRREGEVRLAEVLGMGAGVIEEALEGELALIQSDPPFRAVLIELARLNARVLDHVSMLNRPDLIASMQGKLMATMDRLAPKAEAAPAPFDFAGLAEAE